MNSEADRARPCSLVPSYFLLALWIFHFLGFTTTLIETSDFIKRTRGQICWAYQSVPVYVGINLIDLIVSATAFFVLRRFAKAGRCAAHYTCLGALLTAMFVNAYFNVKYCWP